MAIERKSHIKYIKLEYRNVSNFNKVHIIIIYMDKNTIRLLSKTSNQPHFGPLVCVCLRVWMCMCVCVWMCGLFLFS